MSFIWILVAFEKDGVWFLGDPVTSTTLIGQNSKKNMHNIFSGYILVLKIRRKKSN